MNLEEGFAWRTCKRGRKEYCPQRPTEGSLKQCGLLNMAWTMTPLRPLPKEEQVKNIVVTDCIKAGYKNGILDGFWTRLNVHNHCLIHTHTNLEFIRKTKRQKSLFGHCCWPWRNVCYYRKRPARMWPRRRIRFLLSPSHHATTTNSTTSSTQKKSLTQETEPTCSA